MLTRWSDRVAGSDPGFNRLRAALMSALTIGLIFLVEYLFVRLTHALQVPVAAVALPAAAAAKVAAVNHEFVVIAMLIGAFIGVFGGFIVDSTARGQVVTTACASAALVGTFAMGIALGPYRVGYLVSLGALIALSGYLRRFGGRGVLVGMGLFFGDFMGSFLHKAISEGRIGWVAAEVGVAVAVSAVVRCTLFYPSSAKALRRALRSYRARGARIAGLALALFEDPDHGERGVRRLHRQLVRLNEAALIIDGYLGQLGPADGAAAEALHQRLFDAELALTNLARFAQAMAVSDLPGRQRAEVRLILQAIVRRDPVSARRLAANLIGMVGAEGPAVVGADPVAVVLPRCFAASVISLAEAMSGWLADGEGLDRSGASEAGRPFRPSVGLVGGWLPGAAVVSGAASARPAGPSGRRLRLTLPVRAAIQAAIAGTMAIVLGDLLSGQRYYWAVFAAFVTFAGTSNSGEQARKAFGRVAGTAAGIGIGSLLVTRADGRLGVMLAVLLVAFFLGFYLLRISYAYLVAGLTVAVAVLYEQLGEFSNELLVLRLKETALGAAVTVVVVLVAFPLRNRHVLRTAAGHEIQAVIQLAQHAVTHLIDQAHDSQGTLRAESRAVDASYQALVAAAQPMMPTIFGGPDAHATRMVSLGAALRYYSHNLVADATAAGPLDAATRFLLKTACATLRQSLEAVAAAVDGSGEGTYIRSSALFDQAERQLEKQSPDIGPARLAVRDLEGVDAAMATLAQDLGLAIRDYDTGRADGRPALPASEDRVVPLTGTG